MSSYPLLNVQNGRTWDISANNVTLVGLNGNVTAGQVLTSIGTTFAPTWTNAAGGNLIINNQTASYVLLASDNNKRVIMDVSTANTVTVNNSTFI
jgi:hypothetical protein